MIKIYNPADPSDVIPLQLDDDKRFVTHKYNGRDTLTFEIDGSNPAYQYIAEEVRIDDERNSYVVKTVDEHSDFVTVTCEINLDDWKRDIFYEYRRTNTRLTDIILDILPVGWTSEGDDYFSKRTTIEDTEGNPMMAVTSLQILEKAQEAYSCVFNFDVIGKKLQCIDPTTYKPSGQFFTDELNLKNLGFVGTSEGFATRLYAYGKKDANGVALTFASINGGKPYVEDTSYSNKIIAIGWSDERYEDKQSLMDAAMAMLKAVSFPSRSYTCDAQNLDELDEDVWIYKVVTLIDRRRRTMVNHQIVEYNEYPNHALDTIVLSKTAPSIESFVGRVESVVVEQSKKNNLEIQDLIQGAVDSATEKITGNLGGNFLWIFDSNGLPTELVNLIDSKDVNTAQSLWRWNASGLGYSADGFNGAMKLALLPNGSINASAITSGIMTANIIRAGVLQSADGRFRLDLDTGEVTIGGYATKQELESYSGAINQQRNELDKVEQDLIAIQTESGALSLQVQKVVELGVDKVTTASGYTFKEDGLRIQKAGEEIENKLDNTGMYVNRSGEPMLKANSEGVLATDVTIRNFLNMGENSRFEDYSNGVDDKRTACFAM